MWSPTLGHYKIKMLDKLQALIQLARVLGMYEKGYNPETPEISDQTDNVDPAQWEPSGTIARLIPGHPQK